MRFFDILLALIALLVLAPILIIVMIILRFSGEKEIFFRQKRIGQNGEKFIIFKFATMLKESPNMGTGTITSKDDPRILPVGRILRKTKINELPQLFNILNGSMSIIGPRPHAETDLKGVDPEILNLVLQLKPGLSGAASLIFRNEERLLQSFEEPRQFYDMEIAPYKADIEHWYYDNRNFLLYWKLIILTLLSLVFNEHALVRVFLKDVPKPPLSLQKFFP